MSIAGHLCGIALAQPHTHYIAKNMRRMKAILGAIMATGLPERIVRASGGEAAIFLNGNRITFSTEAQPHTLRGMTIDHIVTEDHRWLDNPDNRAEALPAFRNGIERYTVIG